MLSPGTASTCVYCCWRHARQIWKLEVKEIALFCCTILLLCPFRNGIPGLVAFVEKSKCQKGWDWDKVRHGQIFQLCHDGQRIQAMAYAGDEDVPDEKKAPTSSLPELAVKVSLEIVLLATPHYSPWHNLNGAAHRPWKQHLQRINIWEIWTVNRNVTYIIWQWFWTMYTYLYTL